MSSRKNLTLGQKIFRILSGYEIAIICLILLFLLTFFGTIEQKWFGLWGTIDKYFDLKSIFVIPTNSVGKWIFIPLPGAYWVIVLLSINMLFGGIIRARKGWRKIGVLISHFAILFMLIAGAVSSLYKEEGHMTVTEGRTSDFAVKLFKHNIEIFAFDENGDRQKPAIIPAKELKSLGPKESLTATFENLPFSITIEGNQPHCIIASSKNQPPKYNEPVVDGFYIQKTEKDVKTEEFNHPGCYATVKDSEGNLIQKLILGHYHVRTEKGHILPVVARVSFTHKGVRYGLSYDLAVWPMPFSVELHKAIGENHPNTNIPRWFESQITKVDGSEREDHQIFMNNPARHGGYTLYQAGFTKAVKGAPQKSTFAIVNNPSDRWPEIALWVSFAGLTFHFILSLVRFINRSSKNHKTNTPPPTP